MKKAVFFVLFIGFVGIGQQNDESLNTVYEKFSFAYRTLNAQILSQCYVEDAALLNLYDSSLPNSIKGGQNIVKYFDAFFKRSKAQQLKINLSFKIIDRQKVGENYYDNGYYKLTYTQADGKEQYSYGKLSTIIEWDDGQWKFRVDANCNTDEEEFLNAEVGDLIQPKQ